MPGNFKRQREKKREKAKYSRRLGWSKKKKKKRCSRPKLHSFFIFFLFKFSDTYFPNQKVIFFFLKKKKLCTVGESVTTHTTT